MVGCTRKSNHKTYEQKKKLTVVIIKMIIKINDDLRAINPLTPELNLGSTK